VRSFAESKPDWGAVGVGLNMKSSRAHTALEIVPISPRVIEVLLGARIVDLNGEGQTTVVAAYQRGGYFSDDEHVAGIARFVGVM
jgi:hypothetical protein